MFEFITFSIGGLLSFDSSLRISCTPSNSIDGMLEFILFTEDWRLSLRSDMLLIDKAEKFSSIPEQAADSFVWMFIFIKGKK